METLPLIQIRRKEISDTIARLRSDISAMERELADLDTAARVVARLSGAPTPEDEEAAGKPTNLPTMPEMILEGLRQASKRGQYGLEPKALTLFISDAYWPEVKGEAVSSIAWRMWKRGQIDKDGSHYLLHKEKAADQTSVGDRSAALFDQLADGREAGPGGGT